LALSVLLLGDPGAMPFVGHFRLSLRGPSSAFYAAGRVGSAGGVEGGYAAARSIETTLHSVMEPAAHTLDRNRLLLRAWELLGGLRPEHFGAAFGRDLTLLMGAVDPQGVGVAGVGLSMVWVRHPWGLRPLVDPEHPLLAPPGRPLRVPGVLTLPPGLPGVVGSPSHLVPNAPAPEDVDRRSGVRE
jgi:hypothetical protein